MPFGILDYVLSTYTADDLSLYKAPLLRYAIAALVLYALRRWSAGGTNQTLRQMASRAVLVTGGTSGLGAAAVEELAAQKAQVILLVRDHTDPFTIEYVEDLRRRTENPLVYAETCDLNSLHSVREFATQWINTTPPRRLDVVLCNAAVLAPPFSPAKLTSDELEWHWGVNFLGHYHLLNLLSPAIRVQPPDRDVRIVFTTCAFYGIGTTEAADGSSPWRALGSSKLALMMIAQHFQRQFDAYKRPDGFNSNVRCYCVDPGLVRTPMLRGFLSMGKVWGLLLYLVMWPLWFIVLKSGWEGAQTVLHCVMSPIEYGARGEEGWKSAAYYRDCSEAKYQRDEILSPEACEELKKRTDKEIETAEKKSAVRRKLEEAEKKTPKKEKKKGKGVSKKE